MISYKIICIFCKNEFRLLEGTNKYRMYKQNMGGKFSCDDCDRKIEHEARRALISKLR